MPQIAQARSANPSPPQANANEREDRKDANCAAFVSTPSERGPQGESLACVSVGSRCGKIAVYVRDSSVPQRTLSFEANPNGKYCATQAGDTVSYVGFCPREPYAAWQACYKKLGIK